MLESHPFAGSLSRRSTAPLVVGHRGVPALHQENTLVGFRRAVELGVPAVELDVHLSRDGRAICVHDQDLERLTGTRANVRDLTWDQLRRLRVRRELPMGIDARGAPVLARYEREEPIPLLEEVLAEIAPRAAINVELKLDVERWWHTAVADVTARTIAATGATGRVIVSSFDPRKLLAAQRANPELLVGFCYDDGMLAFAAPLLERWAAWTPSLRWPRRAAAAAAPGVAPASAAELSVDPPAFAIGALPALPSLPSLDAGLLPPLPHRPARTSHAMLTRMLEAHVVNRVVPTRVVAAEHTLLTAQTAQRLHQRGIALGTHTLFPLGSTTGKPIDPAASHPGELARLVALGVDWIETDDPALVLELLARLS